jgi:hypothetical protein
MMIKKIESEHTTEGQSGDEQVSQSTATLLRASVFAVVLALIVLIGAILPAEYGIDLTGIGKAAGLLSLANVSENANVEKSVSIEKQDTGLQDDRIDITVPAGGGLEYKLYMAKGETMRYAWSSDEGELFFDFHGEPEGDASGYFESYTVSTADKVSGSFTASFNGSHGWYWENSSYAPLVITLRTEGKYKVIGLK